MQPVHTKIYKLPTTPFRVPTPQPSMVLHQSSSISFRLRSSSLHVKRRKPVESKLILQDLILHTKAQALELPRLGSTYPQELYFPLEAVRNFHRDFALTSFLVSEMFSAWPEL
jgi:hypothetical protein